MSSHLRRFLLLTLSHAESDDRVHYTPLFVASKCRTLLECQSIIVAKELHKSEGFHYYVGVLNKVASIHTVAKKFREGFSKFEGRQLHLSFHRNSL